VWRDDYGDDDAEYDCDDHHADGDAYNDCAVMMIVKIMDDGSWMMDDVWMDGWMDGSRDVWMYG